MRLTQLLRPAVALSLAATCWPGFFTPANAADIVNRKGGEAKVIGSITASSKADLSVKPQSGDPVIVPAGDIDSVEWDNVPPQMKLGLSQAANNRFAQALDAFNKARTEGKFPNDLVKSELNYQIALTLGRQALIDDTQRDAAIKELTAAQKATPEFFRFYQASVLLGQLQMAAGNYEAAQQAFNTLNSATAKETKLLGKIYGGRILLAQNKPDEAIKQFDEVTSEADGEGMEAVRKYEATLGRAHALIAQNRYADALPGLELMADEAPVEEGAIQAECYLLQGHCLQALGRPKEAVIAYLHVDVLFPSQSASHAEALYHLSRLWKTVQLPDRALEAQGKLQSEYPNSEWVKKLSGGDATTAGS